MPAVNDYVNYSTYGICRIEEIKPVKFDSGRTSRVYYILKPVHQDKSCIYVPVENLTLVEKMRPVLTPQEIDQVIWSVKDQDMSWISDRKKRSEQFQEILKKRDERELLQLISCLYLKSQESKKGLTSSDARILKQAESIIEQEFSFSLKISTQNIGAYIQKRWAAAECEAR